MREQSWQTKCRGQQCKHQFVYGSTYDTPLETQQNLTDQENLFAGGEEDDEKEAGHHTEGTENNLAWAESSDKPSIDNCPQDRTAACETH